MNEFRDCEVGGSVVQARQVGAVHLYPPARPALPRPCELPAIPRVVVDREVELARLTEIAGAAVTGRARAVVIDGAAGIGKSLLARVAVDRVAEQDGDRWPGGVVYEDLGAWPPAVPVETADMAGDGPVAAGVVLGRWLRAAGATPELVPPDLRGRRALWRSLTRERGPIAALADDVPNPDTVRMLLPGRGLLVATSRARMLTLAALDDVDLLTLGPLGEAAAVELITRVLAGLAARTRPPEAVRAVAARCGGSPLAARLAAGRLAGRADAPSATPVPPTMPIGAIVSDQLDAAYRELSPGARQAYQVLALHPGRTWSSAAAAAMLEVTEPDARQVCAELAGHQIVEEAGEDRWRMHDLVRDHARARATSGPAALAPEEQRGAVARACDYYARTAALADHARHPGRRRLGWRANLAATCPAPAMTVEAALTWLDTEAGTIMAAQQAATEHGLFELAYELGEALWGYHQTHRDPGPWQTTMARAADAAYQMRHPVAEARALIGVCLSVADQEQWDQLSHLAHRALGLSRNAGDRLGEASAHEHLGRAHRGRGQHDAAVREFALALEINEQVGAYPRAAGLNWWELGRTHTAAGHLDAALTALGNAHHQLTQADDHYMTGRVHLDQAEAHLRAGNATAALDAIDTALPLITGAAYPYTAGHAELLRARAHLALGDLSAAERHQAAAERAYRDAGAPDTHPALVRARDLANQIRRSAGERRHP